MDRVKFTKGHGVICDSSKVANELILLANNNGYSTYDPFGKPAISYRNIYWDGNRLVRCAPTCVQYRISPKEFLQYISRYEVGDIVQTSIKHPVLPIGSALTVVSKLTPDCYSCRVDSDKNVYALNIKAIRLFKGIISRPDFTKDFFVPLPPAIAKPFDPSFKLASGVKNFINFDDNKVNAFRILPPTAADVKNMLHLDKNRTWKNCLTAAEALMNNGTYGALGAKEPIEDYLKSIQNNSKLTKEEKQFIMEKIKKYSGTNLTARQKMDVHVLPADLMRRMYEGGSPQMRKMINDCVQPFTGEVLTAQLKEIIKLSRGYVFYSEITHLFPTLKDNRIVVNPVLIGTDVFKSTDGEFLLTTIRSGEYLNMGFRLNGKLNWSIVTDEESRLCLVPKYK